MMRFRAIILFFIQNEISGTTVLPSSQEIAENYLRRVAGYVAADVDMMPHDGAGMTPERSDRIKKVIFEVVDMSISTQRPFYELNEIAVTLNEFRSRKTTEPEFFLCYVFGQHLHAFPQAFVEMMNSFEGLSRLINLARIYGMSARDTFLWMYHPLPWNGERSAIQLKEGTATSGPYVNAQTNGPFAMVGVPDEEFIDLLRMRYQFETLFPSSEGRFLRSELALVSLQFSSLPASHETKTLIRKSLDIMTGLSEATKQANQQHYMNALEVLLDFCYDDIAYSLNSLIPRLTPPIRILEAALHSTTSASSCLKSELIERVISSFSGTLLAPLLIKAVRLSPVANLHLFEVLIDIAVRVMQRSPSSLSSLASVIDSIDDAFFRVQRADNSNHLLHAAFVLTSKFGIRVLHDYPGWLSAMNEWSSEKILAIRTIIGCTIHFDHRADWYRMSYTGINIAGASDSLLKQAASILSVTNNRLIINSWSDAPLLTPAILFDYLSQSIDHSFALDIHNHYLMINLTPAAESLRKVRYVDRLNNLPRLVNEFLVFDLRRLEVYEAMEQRANRISENYRGRIPIDVMDGILAFPSNMLNAEIIHSKFSGRVGCFKPITDKLFNPAFDLIEAVGQAPASSLPNAFSRMRECLGSIKDIVGVCLETGRVEGVDQLIAEMQRVIQAVGLDPGALAIPITIFD